MEIIDLIQQNTRQSNLKAWKYLTQRCTKKLKGVLWKSGVDDLNQLQEILDESLADAFLNVLRGKFRADADICSYVIGIAMNKKKTYGKWKTNAVSDDLLERFPAQPDIRHDQIDWKSVIRKVFLDHHCTDSLIDYYFKYGANYGRMASAIQRPVDEHDRVYERVKKQVNRCLDRLREYYKAQKNNAGTG